MSVSVHYGTSNPNLNTWVMPDLQFREFSTHFMGALNTKEYMKAEIILKSTPDVYDRLRTSSFFQRILETSVISKDYEHVCEVCEVLNNADRDTTITRIFHVTCLLKLSRSDEARDYILKHGQSFFTDDMIDSIELDSSFDMEFFSILRTTLLGHYRDSLQGSPTCAEYIFVEPTTHKVDTQTVVTETEE